MVSGSQDLRADVGVSTGEVGAWRLRWYSVLSCAAARAFAASLLELRGGHGMGKCRPPMRWSVNNTTQGCVVDALLCSARTDCSFLHAKKISKLERIMMFTFFCAPARSCLGEFSTLFRGSTSGVLVRRSGMSRCNFNVLSKVSCTHCLEKRSSATRDTLRGVKLKRLMTPTHVDA